MIKNRRKTEGLPKFGKLIFRVGVPKKIKGEVLIKLISAPGSGVRIMEI